MQPRGLGRQAELLILLRRKIDDDEPVDARLARILQEFRHAILIDRIVVAHEDDRRRRLLAAEVAHELKRLLHRLPGGERAQRGGLDRRPVGHGIGEGHAELDHIGAGAGQRLHQSERGRGIGIARRDEGHEPGAARGLELGEALIEPIGGPVGAAAAEAHSFVPRCLAAEKMSLSPRPQRLTTIR